MRKGEPKGLASREFIPMWDEELEYEGATGRRWYKNRAARRDRRAEKVLVRKQVAQALEERL